MAKSRRRAPRKTKRRTRWTLELARKVLAELAESGMSVGAFAAGRRLHPQRLYRWRQRLAQESAPATEAPTFAEVTVRGRGRQQCDLERFEVELGRGRIVRVGPSFDAEALRRLVRVLEEDGLC